MDRFDAAPYIKDIGRGSQHPSDLSCERAFDLWHAVLSGRLDPVALGGTLIALRVKGESADEMAGFLDACNHFGQILQVPAGHSMPVVIPSYNGARKLPNLTPLLALLLARQGVLVLVHGSSGSDIPKSRPARVTSAGLFDGLGIGAVQDGAEAQQRWASLLPAFISIDQLKPELAHVLSQRAVLGVRNSSHTLVKLLQPFHQPALCLSSYTHPEYLTMLGDLLMRDQLLVRQDTLLLRGTEGEAVANARRALPMQWFARAGARLLEPNQVHFEEPAGLPAECGIEHTVRYIEAVMADRLPVPAPIAWQVTSILAARSSALEPSVLSTAP